MATIGDHVAATIDSFERSELDFAVLHACLAVDATARRVDPGEPSNRKRFVRFLRDFYWVLEPTAMPGFDLEQSRFSNVPLKNLANPDWAEVVYEIHRCSHAHGDHVPDGFRLVPGVGLSMKSGRIGDGVLEMPDNLPFGLLFAVVLCPGNFGERVPDGLLPDDRARGPQQSDAGSDQRLVGRCGRVPADRAPSQSGSRERPDVMVPARRPGVSGAAVRLWLRQLAP